MLTGDACEIRTHAGNSQWISLATGYFAVSQVNNQRRAPAIPVWAILFKAWYALWVQPDTQGGYPSCQQAPARSQWSCIWNVCWKDPQWFYLFSKVQPQPGEWSSDPACVAQLVHAWTKADEDAASQLNKPAHPMLSIYSSSRSFRGRGEDRVITTFITIMQTERASKLLQCPPCSVSAQLLTAQLLTALFHMLYF